MIIRFLNLFAAFRDAVSARLIAESDSRRERSRADRLDERVRELERELIDVHKSLNDKLGQRFLNVRFWTEAEHRDAPKNPGVSFGRQQARSVQEQATASFYENMDEYLKKQSQ